MAESKQALSRQQANQQEETKPQSQACVVAESAVVHATQAIACIRSDLDGCILTRAFLDICRSALIVLDKLGPTMAVIRADVDGNIRRLDEILNRKTEYTFLFEIVRDEARAKTAKKPLSCTRAILWLTRSMDFTGSLFRNLLDHPGWSLTTAVEEAYSGTLKPWHGWISAAAFKVGLKLIPQRQEFLDVVSGKPSMLNKEMETFVSLLCPVLEEIHNFLKSLKLNRLKST